MFHRVKVIKPQFCIMCHTSSKIGTVPMDRFNRYSHRKKLEVYFKSATHLEDAKIYIPPKHLQQRKGAISDILYLVDSQLAKKIAQRILPEILKRKNQMICETNPGLGYLTGELLEGGVPFLRLYETCSDFRRTLKGFNDTYPGQVELFVKNIFHIWKFSFLDKIDKLNRVDQFLKGIPKRSWSDEPPMTIIGTMGKLDFMKYVIRMIALQTELVSYGRPELFAIITPGDYLKLTAGPTMNYHIYQTESVLYNIFCTTTLIDKYPRIAFLPWEPTLKINPRTRMTKKYDPKHLYLVHIQFKKELPLEPEEYLPFYFFVRQFFGKGTTKVIPKLEQWVSGVGMDIIAPENTHLKLRDIGIYTTTGELTPEEILKVFRIFHQHPGYISSSFTEMIDAELLKTETVETDMSDIDIKPVETNKSE